MEQATLHRRQISTRTEAPADENLSEAINHLLTRPQTVEAPAPASRPIADILTERQSTHGDFTDNAYIMQRLKDVMHQSKNWTAMTDVQREALHMIVHKIGRICSGNPNTHDHWDDIAGYAKLVSERI